VEEKIRRLKEKISKISSPIAASEVNDE